METEYILKDGGYERYNTGIEPDEEKEDNMDPFDPEEISIDSKVIAMDNILRRLTQGSIILNPDFQRAEVWTPEKKSQLIESMMLMIPLPMFYVSADEKNNFTVVDGLQRLSTIRSFVLGDKFLAGKEERFKGEGFKLKGLEFWKDYEGRNFNDLPTNIKNRILETEFRFTVINPGTPEEVRRNIFKRLNTGGMPLSSQEIRNALYLGKSTQLLNELASYAVFKDATVGSIKSLRMEDKELILRFLAFLIRDFTNYRRTVSIDSYLSDTMIILNSLPDLETRELSKAVKTGRVVKQEINPLSYNEISLKFQEGMQRAHQFFGQHAFRKSFEGKRRSSINKSLFETWGVLLAQLSDFEFEILLKNREKFMEDYEPIIGDYNFQISISRDSMKAPAVQKRFNTFMELLERHKL